METNSPKTSLIHVVAQAMFEAVMEDRYETGVRPEWQDLLLGKESWLAAAQLFIDRNHLER